MKSHHDGLLSRSSSSLYFTIAILFFLFVYVQLTLGISSDDSDDTNIKIERYGKCKNIKFQCGNLVAGYPFWGNFLDNLRPDFCGAPGYKLDCRTKGFRTEIHIKTETYQVKEINGLHRIIRISKTESWTNKSLDSTLFSDVTGSMTGDDLRLNYGSDGVAANMSYCRKCVKSDGACGFDATTTKPTCFCKLGSTIDNQTATCSQPGTLSQIPPTNQIPPPPPINQIPSSKLAIGVAAGLAGVIVLAFIVILTFRCAWKKHSLQSEMVAWGKETNENANQNMEAFFKNCGSLAPKRYRYSDIKKMTSSFKEKLGQGGYGAVFKGQLHDGVIVAVKVLFEKSETDGQEFINEVASISRTSHINVVTLLGFCYEGKKRALVYEFMPNGSLEKYIYNEPPFSSSGHSQIGLETLYQIAIGIARGLEYLHRGCNTRILHFDIKPHNILLDKEFCPKIADFGLANLCQRDESIISIMGARGTAGYIAPEVFSRNIGGVSHKSDVYSYGMMILEMAGGRKNVDVRVGMDRTSQLYFPHWIYERINKKEDLGLQGIMSEAGEEVARMMIIVGLWCIQTNPLNRPSMSQVLDMLETKVEELEIPPKPFLSSPSRLMPQTKSSTISTSDPCQSVLNAR